MSASWPNLAEMAAWYWEDILSDPISPLSAMSGLCLPAISMELTVRSHEILPLKAIFRQPLNAFYHVQGYGLGSADGRWWRDHL